jgi:hypothetical protein
MKKNNIIILMLIILISLNTSFSFGLDTYLVDFFIGTNDDQVNMQRCDTGGNSILQPIQIQGISGAIGNNFTISYTFSTTTTAANTDIVNFTIVGAGADGKPNGVIYCENGAYYSGLRYDTSQAINTSCILTKELPINTWVLPVLTLPASADTRVISANCDNAVTSGEWHGIPNYGRMDSNNNYCKIAAMTISNDFTTRVMPFMAHIIQNLNYINPVFENPTPLNGDVDNTQRIINISCFESNVTLWFGNETNLTNVINGFEHGSLFSWITNVSLSDTYYYKASCDNGTIYNTSLRSWIYDIDAPIIRTNFKNNTNIYLGNLSAQFNLSDNILLHGFNISIDGITFYNISHIHNIDYSYNFSYNPKEKGLSYGIHLINLRVSDGHTAKELYSPEDIEVTTPFLLNNELNYKIKEDPYLKNELKLYNKEKDLLDKWEYEFKKDKIIEKLTPKNPKSRMSFIFESKSKIYLVEKAGKYGGKWLITGDKWKDFIIKGDNLAYIESITLINDFKAEIVINNIQNPNYIEFESTGDLNIINKQYFFSYNNLSINSVSSLPSSALSNEDLKGYCNASSSSELNLTLGYIWYKNKQLLESNIYNSEYSTNLNQTPLKTTIETGLTSYTYINYSNPFLRDYKISFTFESINYNLSNTNCINSIISIRRSASAISKEISCLNYNTNLYETIKTAGELEELNYNGLYLNTSKPLNLSNQNILIKTLDKKNLSEGDNFTFSCSASNGFLFTGYTNSSITNILTLNLGLCSASLIYPVFNLTTYDEVSKEKIATNKGYNLRIYDNVNYKNISLNIISTISDSFCTNINPSSRFINWSIWNDILISKTNYATRLYELDEGIPLRVYNSNQDNLSYYLIALNESTTVTFNWFTTAYQRISGIQNIYRCNGDNTKTLVDSTPIIDGASVTNIEVLNIPYSYTIIYNGKEYIDKNSYSKCHIEATPLTSINYYIDISEEDFNNYLLLSQLECNLTKSGNSQASLNWGSLANVEGKLLIYQNNNYLTETSSTNKPLIYNLIDSQNNYNIIAYLKLNGNIRSCGEVSFNQNKTNSQLLGLMGAFACFILLASLVLLFAGEKEKTLLIMAIGIICLFILALTSLSWQTIISMIALILLTIYIGRYIRK